MNGSRVRMGRTALLVVGLALVLAIALTACSTGSGPTTAPPAITAGTHHALVLKSDGSVWAWGYGGYGELGDGSTNTSDTPVEVQGLP